MHWQNCNNKHLMLISRHTLLPQQHPSIRHFCSDFPVKNKRERTPHIRSLRDEGGAEGRPPRDLVYCTPSESLQAVVDRLFAAHCSMAPVLSKDPESACADWLLMLACMMGGCMHCGKQRGTFARESVHDGWLHAL